MRILYGIGILSTFLVLHSCFSMEQLREYNLNQPNIMERDFVVGFGYHSFEETNECIAKNHQIISTWHTPSSKDPCLLLHIAVEKNNIRAARALLQTQPSIINIPTARNKYTPLHMVNSKAMTKLLVAYGANLESKDIQGATPLSHVLYHQVGCYSGFFCGLRFDHSQRCETAHYLLKKGADKNAVIDQEGNTLLHCAVGRGFSLVSRHPEYIALLLRFSANIECKNTKDETSYGLAISQISHCENVLKVFKNKNIFFIKKDSQPDIFKLLSGEAEKFKTFIEYHSLKGQSIYDEIKTEEQIANLFAIARNNSSLGKGIITQYYQGYCFNNINYADLQEWIGKDSIEYVDRYFNDCCQKVLSLALNGQFKELDNILYHYPFALKYDKKIVFTLLHHMMSTNTNVFSELLNKTPDLNIVDEDGNTLLHKAVELKNAEAIGLLIKHGSFLFVANTNRKTSIDLLRELNDQRCIEAFESSFITQFFKTYSYQPLYKDYKKIIQSGFDVNMCDEKGQSMLWKAVKEHPEKLSLLLKQGAEVTQEMIDYAKSEHQYMEIELLKKYLKK